MAIIRDQAIIIHSIKHGDSSLIVQVVTRDNGRNSLIAKGARNKKPRFGAALEVMTHSEVIYSHKPTREIQILRDARIINSFLPIRDNLERTALGLAVCELLRMVTPVAESSSEIFDVSVHALESISNAIKNVRNHFWRFELELFRPLGIGLSLSNCVQCGRAPTAEKDTEVEFDSANGAIRCSECKTGSGIVLPMEAYRVLEFLNRTNIRSVENISISKRAESVIKSTLSLHLRMHLPVHRDLKSLDALNWGSS
jgi:DNA repair protein RecO (recombination protein O)